MPECCLCDFGPGEISGQPGQRAACHGRAGVEQCCEAIGNEVSMETLYVMIFIGSVVGFTIGVKHLCLKSLKGRDEKTA